MTEPAGRTCPHPDCAEQLPATRFACDRHWFALSPQLRVWVSRAWRSIGAPGSVERHYRVATLAEIEERALDSWAGDELLAEYLDGLRTGPRREGRR